MYTKKQFHTRNFSVTGLIYILYYIIFYIIQLNDSTHTLGSYVAGVIPVIFLFVIFAMCSNTVEADEIGVIQLFGKPILQVPSGYVCTFPFYDLIKTKGTQIEIHFPEKNDIPNPIRITHGAAKESTSDPLDTRLTTSVSLVVSYRMISYIDFIKTIGDFNELRKQIRDKLINTTAIECAKLTLAFNLTHSRREEINLVLKKAIIDYTYAWGIQIISVQLQEIDLGNEIDIAQKNRSISEINTIVNRNNAQKILYEGMSEAKVSEAFLFAKAEGLKELSTKLGIEDKLLVLQLDTLANVFRKSNADLNLYGNNFQQLFNMVMTAYKSNNNDDDAKKIT